MKSAFKWAFRALAALGILVLALKVGDRWVRHSAVLPEIPDPNGFAVLMEVAQKIQGPEGDMAEVSADKVREFATGQRGLLDQVRVAVRGPSGVTLEADPAWAEVRLGDLTRLKRLAVLVGLRSRADLLEGRTNAAARSWVDMILVGQVMARGGRKLEALSGMAVERVGATSLRAMVPMLDADTCRGLARDLEKAEEARERPDRILETERNWSLATFGLIAKGGEFLGRRSEVKARETFLTRYHDTEKATRRLILALAARSEFLRTGREATQPSELVPGILKAIPVDPNTGAPFTDLPTGR